jgi:multidrug efflux pump subunit AcrA (membrane-fusion protein)
MHCIYSHRELAEETLKEMQEQAEAERVARLHALEAHEKRQSQLRSTDFIMEELVDSVLKDEVTRASSEQMKQVNAQLTQESETRVINQMTATFLGEVSISMCSAVAAEVYEVDVVQRLQQLEDAEHAVKAMHTARFFFIWKKQLAGIFPSPPFRLVISSILNLDILE